MELPFLAQSEHLSKSDIVTPFSGVFIRAPVVEQLLLAHSGKVDPVGQDGDAKARVEVLGVLPNRTKRAKGGPLDASTEVTGGEVNDIVAVRQGNVMGTSFHPELTDDIRIHVWWLEQVLRRLDAAGSAEGI